MAKVQRHFRSVRKCLRFIPQWMLLLCTVLVIFDAPSGVDCVFDYLQQYVRNKLTTFTPTAVDVDRRPTTPSTNIPSYALLELLLTSGGQTQNSADHQRRNETSLRRTNSITSFVGLPAAPLDTLTCCAMYRRCFDLFGDFFHILRRPFNLPPDCNVDVSFILNTRRFNTGALSTNTFRLPPSNSGAGEGNYDSAAWHLSQADFDPSRPATIFIIHGFISLANGSYFWGLKDALLKRADVNVFRVNWEKAAIMPYTQATSNTRIVGAIVGKFIEFLVRHFALAPNRVHIIGHSLGAHIAGYAAKELGETRRVLLNEQKSQFLLPPPDSSTSTLRNLLARILLTKQRIGRITALDPAAPFFANLPSSVRLDRRDADFVEVYHTDVVGFGMAESLGHVDYFPNGGGEQPGCTDSYWNAAWTTIANLSVTAGRDELSCSHARAILLYTDMVLVSSINIHFQPTPEYPTTHVAAVSELPLHAVIHNARPISAEPAVIRKRMTTSRKTITTIDDDIDQTLRRGRTQAKYRRALRSEVATNHDTLTMTQSTCSYVAFKCDTYQNFLDAKCVDCSSSPSQCKLPPDYFPASPNSSPRTAEFDQIPSKYFILTSKPSTTTLAEPGTDRIVQRNGFCLFHIVIAVELARHDEAGRARPAEQEAVVHIRLHYQYAAKQSQPGTSLLGVSEEIALSNSGRRAQDDSSSSTFQAGRVRTFLIGSPAPLHAIQGVSVRWSNVRSKLNPLRWTYALFGYDDPNMMLLKSVALLSAVEPTSHGQVAATAVRARTSSSGNGGSSLITVKENHEVLVPMVGWYSID